MEKDTKEKRAEVNPPLFKFAIPLALSLVAITISTLTRRSTARKKPSQEQHQMDYPESMSQYEFEDEDGSSSEEESEEEEEEEEAEEDDDVDEAEEEEKEDSGAEEEEKPQSSTHLLESSKEISIEQCHEEPNSGEQIEDMRCLVANVEDRQSMLEQQFYDYCNMKEQESAFQKLQIMCLGLKLESLESKNQRLEVTIKEFRGAMERVQLMRAEMKLLQRKANKLTRANGEYSHLIKYYVSKLQEKDEISRSNEEFHQATKVIKEVTDQLHKEIKAMEEKLEVRPSKIEDMTRSDDMEMFGQLQQLREKWSADMEELIYVGWINACLRREIILIQKEEEEEVGDDDDDDIEEEMKAVPDLRDEVVMELPHDWHVKNCSIELYDMNSPLGVADAEDACRSVVSAKSPGRSSKKPRLLRKLKGWATGKGKCKRACSKGNSSEG